MFIRDTSQYEYNDRDHRSSIIKLENNDYYKRFIVVEMKENFPLQDITMYNISSNTGKGILMNKISHRIQTTFVYHGRGNLFNGLIEDIEIAKRVINYDSYLEFEYASYGIRDVDFSRNKRAQLQISSLYSDLQNGFNAPHLTEIPHPKFYNIEHQLLEDPNRDYGSGNDLYYNPIFNCVSKTYTIPLMDLMDDETKIIITKGSTYENYSNDSYLEKDTLEKLFKYIVGPCTELSHSILVDSYRMVYDSNTGTSDIAYLNSHPMPNGEIFNDIRTNALMNFEESIIHVGDWIGYRFKIFIESNIGKIKITFYILDNRGRKTHKCETEIGRFSNKQYSDTIHYCQNDIYSYMI